jgi:hypothetical protein
MERLNPAWRKSSYSGNGGANCVETGNAPGAVLVRDTKNKGTGPMISVSPHQWGLFLKAVRGGTAVNA